LEVEGAGCGEIASGACASKDAGRLTPGESWITDDDG
jgi:hypothetical protein